MVVFKHWVHHGKSISVDSTMLTFAKELQVWTQPCDSRWTGFTSDWCNSAYCECSGCYTTWNLHHWSRSYKPPVYPFRRLVALYNSWAMIMLVQGLRFIRWIYRTDFREARSISSPFQCQYAVDLIPGMAVIDKRCVSGLYLSLTYLSF